MKRKSTAYRIVQVFFLAAIVILLPITAWAQETTLTTVVPSSHTIHMELTGDGTVFVDGVAYTKTADIQVQRQHRPEISIQAEDGSKIKTVLWCGENIAAAFYNGTWTAQEMLEDAELTVIFEKASSSPQTRDAFHPELWFGLLICSALGMIACLLRGKKDFT